MKMSYFIPGSKRAQHIASGQAMFAGKNGAGGGATIETEEDEWGTDEDEEGDSDADDEDESSDEDEPDEDEADEDDNVDAEKEQRALISKIKKSVGSEMRKQMVSRSTQKQIRTVVGKALAGLKPEELKNFKNVEKTVRTMAASFEKFKNQVNANQKRDYMKEVLEKNMDKIANLYTSRTEGRSIKLNVRAAVIVDTDNIVTGAIDDNVIESFSIDEFQPKRRPRQYVSDIADVTRVTDIDQFKIWYDEGSEEGAIALVAEGGLKPLVSLSLVRNQHEVRKAAGKMVFTEEVTKFRKRAYQIIRQLFNDKVWRDYQNILSADLVAAAAPYSGTTLDGQFATPTDFHAIGAVAAQIESLNFIPDTLIINPQDKWRMALSQGSDGHFYMAIPTMSVDGSISMFGFRVITTNKIAAGNFMLGEGGLYKIEEEAVQVRMGYGISMNGTTPEHDFDHNRFRIIGEVFFHNYISSSNAGSFVYGNFATIKTALTTTP